MDQTNLVLHTFRRCPFAIRVRMVLEEKGIEYSKIEEDLSKPSSNLLKCNPEGSVPVLTHNGKVLLESAIITEYLNEVFEDKDLMPEDPFERAQVRFLTKWCDTVFKPDLDLYKYEFKNLSNSEQFELLERLKVYFDKLQIQLSDRHFLVGNQITLADIHLFPFYRQIQKSNPLFNEHFSIAKLNTWLERIVVRPSFAKVMQK